MKCDLHVHTTGSGMCTIPVLSRFCRESYNEPGLVFETLKKRGMDLITITDHDSIESSEAFRARKDFFVSEEVSSLTPTGTQIHVGVYDIQDQHHTQLQRRRDDVISMVEYLREQKLFFSINHVFSSLTGPRTDHDFALFENHFPGIETLNGQMLACSNLAAAELAQRWRKAPVGGSDAHTLTSLGKAYTEEPGAQNAAGFLLGLQRGLGRVHGASGDYWKLTRAVLEIGIAMIRERPATAALGPLLAAIPFIMLGNLAGEITFAKKWMNRLRCGRMHYDSVEGLVEFIRA